MHRLRCELQHQLNPYQEGPNSAAHRMAGPVMELVSSAAATAQATSAPVVLPKTSESDQLLKIRHSMSHVMAMAVQQLFPKARVTIGPWTESGFYYDFDNPDPFTEADLKAIKKDDQDHQQEAPPGAGRGKPQRGRSQDRGSERALQLEILEGLQERSPSTPWVRTGGSVPDRTSSTPANSMPRPRAGKRGRRLLAGR